MCMTKKDFKAIASILAEAKRGYPDEYDAILVDTITSALDDLFEENYPRYDSEKFLTKAGYFDE